MEVRPFLIVPTNNGVEVIARTPLQSIEPGVHTSSIEHYQIDAMGQVVDARRTTKVYRGNDQPVLQHNRLDIPPGTEGQIIQDGNEQGFILKLTTPATD